MLISGASVGLGRRGFSGDAIAIRIVVVNLPEKDQFNQRCGTALDKVILTCQCYQQYPRSDNNV